MRQPDESSQRSVAVDTLDPNQELECVIPKDDFEGLRRDPQFIRIIQLARYQNQLSFCLAASPKVADVNRGTHGASRQLINGLLYGSAILFEGIGQLRDAMSQFKYYASYNDVFRPYIRDPNTHRLRECYLEHIRNTFVAHVDREVIAKTLEWVSYDEYVFLGGAPDDKVVYYPLADNIGITATIGPHDDDDSEMETFADYLDSWKKGTVGFNNVVNSVLHEYREKKRWAFRTAKR